MMLPGFNNSALYDPEQYRAWANEAQDNSSSYHSPASSPKSSSSSYESCSEGASSSTSSSKGKGIFSSLSKIGRRSTHASAEVDRKQLKKFVSKAYKDIRFYHGTTATGARSIRVNGMSVRYKRGGLTEVAVAEAPNQSREVIQRSRRYNYLTTVHGAAKSYALPASVTSTRTWQPKAGEDGVPRLVRLFKTADFPRLEKDSDFPLSFVPLLNPLYRTSSDIPAHAVRQAGRGSQRYSREIVSAIREQMAAKFKFSASVEQVRQCLSDVESDSDDDFPRR